MKTAIVYVLASLAEIAGCFSFWPGFASAVTAVARAGHGLAGGPLRTF